MHNFLEAVMAITIVGMVTLTIYRLFELFVRRKERMAIIEKVSSGIDLSGMKDDLSLAFFQKPETSSWALRISLLLVGIGLGMIIGFAIVSYYSEYYISDDGRYNRMREQIEIVYPACISIFGGLGLFIAYMVEQQKNKK